MKLKLTRFASFTIPVFLMFSDAAFAAGEPSPVDLQCEHLVRPLGIDASKPRLSWRIEDSQGTAVQAACQVIVGTDSVEVTKGIGNMWNSGKLMTGNQMISYSGKVLNRFSSYFWRVELWDGQGKKLSSAVSSFETGMMGNGGWRGNWISDGQSMDTRPAPYFRKEFNSGKRVKSARAYIAVAGLYELYINGKKIGNHRLDPVYTRFDRRNVYVTYDVTASLQEGRNAVGVLLGNGWYNHQPLAVWDFDRAPWRNRPAFCFDLRITYEDNSTETISSSLDWKSSSGAILSNNIYTGEHYDARKELSGWSSANFDDSKWRGVNLRSAPSQNVVAQALHPIRNVEKIPAKSAKQMNDSTWLFDLGRNIAGVAEISVKGEEGTVLRLTHGERLKDDGNLDMSNIDVYYRPRDNKDPFQTDFYTLSGKGTETFMPKFNYKGFQYVEVTTSKPVKFTRESLTGYFMHSDVPVAGKISSSDNLINKIWAATNNSYLSNLYGYPTDCPQREKNGWTGDGHFAVESGLYNFDAITIYEKWLADHRDEQQPNGVLPDIIPTGGWGYGTANGTDWTSTIAIIPWNVYLFYGDSRLLEECYDNIRRYVNYVESISPDGLTSWGRGDWVPVKSQSSLELTSSVYYYADALILSKAAGLFGKKEDQTYYSALAEKIRKAINGKYFNAAAGTYASGTQTELSVPLFWGLVPEEYKQKVAANLARKVEESNFHLDVGVLGAKAILNALSENGYGETAYKLARQDTYPSWGWWIVNGATTLYENWDIKAARDISLNHMMFGEIGAWLYKGPGGIKPDERHPGFKNVLLEPTFPAGLNEFSAEHSGPYGIIRSAWKKTGNKVIYSVTVPPNSTAEARLPAGKTKILDVNGKRSANTNLAAVTNSGALKDSYSLQPGTYRFEIR
ncbi:alpha-L-rhamnosidase [Pararcticibacter amylolyticus]|uniref:alpha-L-rhamnosidase n=1 Tax=Pararcticibacter amylolyticus TaxID=2173175 RepID=A0A2U2PB78_9SPHI|nr:alpha-L-rhamnosidase [Pararcticibacter amylolyticus]PWG78642.1 alpha-rhamnosidase [Pararcticibacter amylolyticus]